MNGLIMDSGDFWGSSISIHRSAALMVSNGVSVMDICGKILPYSVCMGWSTPHAFMTNGGGSHRYRREAEKSFWLLFAFLHVRNVLAFFSAISGYANDMHGYPLSF